jgi:hypothetical protein
MQSGDVGDGLLVATRSRRERINRQAADENAVGRGQLFPLLA